MNSLSCLTAWEVFICFVVYVGFCQVTFSDAQNDDFVNKTENPAARKVFEDRVSELKTSLESSKNKNAGSLSSRKFK